VKSVLCHSRSVLAAQRIKHAQRGRYGYKAAWDNITVMA